MSIKEAILELRNRIRIEEVIGRYINLKKSGKNYIANCPFHNDKTPSFTVSSEKGFYHCFGCGKSGDIFTFVMEIEKISFMEAVKKLAMEYGVDIDSFLSKSSKSSKLISNLKQINIEAQKFFSSYLTKGDKSKEGIKYLKSRKVDSKTAEKFKFGMAPNSKDTLYRFLKSKFFTDDTIFESRLVVNTSSGPIDTFRYRITLPIENEYGEIVGFAGRTLSKDEKAKYLNLPETPIFKKRNILFGLNHARNSIRETGRVILVEGYFDVISLHKNNITNSCGVMGSALTLEQLRLISKMAKEIYLFFDNDSAGLNATERTIPFIINNSDLEVKIVKTPYKDPDEFISSFEHKTETIDQNLITKYSYNIIDFFLEVNKEQIRTSDKNIKMSFLTRMFYFISLLKNIYDKEEGLKKIAEVMKVSEVIIKSEFEKYQQKQKIISDNISISYSKLPSSSLEIVISYFISKNNSLLENLKAEVDIQDIKDETSRNYLSFLDNYLNNEEIDDDKINTLYLLQSEVESKASSIIKTFSENLKDDFEFLLTLYKIKTIREKKKELQSIIEKVSKTSPDQELIEELLEEKQFLTIEEKKIKETKKISY
ncbi:MAG: DNA primase [Brevinematales bacterium]|nr:DNA primase [Brevinematales bacterium]